jgi:hypothetical protein
MNKLKMIFVMAIAIFSFNSGEAQTSKQKSKTKKETTAMHYQCPMKCEGEKTYHKDGKCPVCNMQLKAIKAPPVQTASYQCPMKCEGAKTYAKAGKCPVCQMDLKILQVKKTDDVNYSPNAKADTTKKSIKAAATGKIGQAEITINYHSPGVRNRVIWGGLVPYNDVWVTGAHSATTVEINKAFILGGKKIAAGKYALFSIPGENEWTVILNANWQQHLADDYDAKDDIIRIKVKPVENIHTERLEYFIENHGANKGKIAIAWAKLKVEMPVTIQD